jgi:hypothetical protein
MKSCDTKKRFPTIEDSAQAADRYMERMALVAAPMKPYQCKAHSCWHIGHSRWLRGRAADAYSVSARRRDRLRGEMMVLTLALEVLDGHLGGGARNVLAEAA